MHSRWQRTRKQRRATAIAKLIEEAGLELSPSVRDFARHVGPSPQLERLTALASDDFVENARHLRLVVPDALEGALLATFAASVARLGHPTRWLSLRELCERLYEARAGGRLDAELRELDRISLIAVHSPPQDELDAGRLDLIARCLRHREDRGSVALAGFAAAKWRSAAQVDPASSAAITAFLDRCEVVDLSAPEALKFPSPDFPFLRMIGSGSGERQESATAGDAETGVVRA
jgi:hypothetical protein